MKFRLLAAASATALVIAGASQAAVISLNFEGVNATYPSGFAFVENFYNGGTSSDGTSGVNYGVAFSPNAQAICLNSTSVSCSNTSRGGLAPGSDKGGLFFLAGSSTIMDVAAGFTTGFSFNYTNPFGIASVVDVYDGLDGAGTLLGSFALGATAGSCPGYGAAFCPFSPIGVAFAGTAKSVSFGGVANEIVFDDITFGSVTPGSGPGVPEPSTWALGILGMGIAGAGVRSKRRRQSTFA